MQFYAMHSWRSRAVYCCELDLHQCFSFSNSPRLSFVQIEQPIHLRFYYPIRRNNQLRCQGFHACEEPTPRWLCSTPPLIGGDARGNVIMRLVAASWFRSSDPRVLCGALCACVDKPGAIASCGTILVRIEIEIVAITSHLLGGDKYTLFTLLSGPISGLRNHTVKHKPNTRQPSL